jgi:hypothetical protein
MVLFFVFLSRPIALVEELCKAACYRTFRLREPSLKETASVGEPLFSARCVYYNTTPEVVIQVGRSTYSLPSRSV